MVFIYLLWVFCFLVVVVSNVFDFCFDDCVKMSERNLMKRLMMRGILLNNLDLYNFGLILLIIILLFFVGEEVFSLLVSF